MSEVKLVASLVAHTCRVRGIAEFLAAHLESALGRLFTQPFPELYTSSEARG